MGLKSLELDPRDVALRVPVTGCSGDKWPHRLALTWAGTLIPLHHGRTREEIKAGLVMDALGRHDNKCLRVIRRWAEESSPTQDYKVDADYIRTIVEYPQLLHAVHTRGLVTVAREQRALDEARKRRKKLRGGR